MRVRSTVYTGLMLCSAVLANAAEKEQTVPSSIPSDVAARITSAHAGDAIDIGELDLTKALVMERLVKAAKKSPELLISDDPEYIRVPEAIALQETVKPGTVRLYVYNVNGVKEQKQPRKISAVIENLGEKPLNLRMLHSAFQKPSGDYSEIGKTGLERFFKSIEQSSLRQIPPAGATVIDDAMDKSVAEYDELVHGFYEFEINEPARISVIQTDPKKSSTLVVKTLKEVLPVKNASGAGRGKFETCDFDVTTTFDYAKGMQQIVLADGITDPWIVGTESTTKTEAVLKGNYGVMYDIEIERINADNRPVALLMYNQRFGSPWCDAMAASVVVTSADGEREVVRVPSNKTTTKSLPEAVVVKVFPAPTGRKDKIHILYSPPGASCLPTPLVLVPLD